MRAPRAVGAVVALLLGAACVPGDGEPDDGLTLLSPREQLVRASMDLRGIHPTEEELQAIDADPALYPQFVDRYLDDPRFSERMRELYDLRFLTRTGDTYFDPAEAGLADVDAADVARSIADEPLRLLSHLVERDLPITDLVLADYTMADPILARMWDLEYPEGESGWQPATYRDGRPAAGVLTMTTTWQRYPSMGGNANRHRANAVARTLLCDDYLARPIVLDRAAVDQLTVDPEDAIASNTTCQSCHSTLDPLAAHFFGFFHYDATGDLRDATTYLPENEEAWRDYSGEPPGYFGTPTASLDELADAIASDPRFVDCAARTVLEGLGQRAYEDADWSDFQLHRQVFVDAGLRVRPLVRSVVTSRAYLAVAAADAALAERLATVRTASPAQLAAVIEALTGYRWTFDGRDGLTEHDLGLPVLAGGIDGRYVTSPSREPAVGSVLVLERLAQAAAWHVAAHDLDPERTDPATLLAFVTVEDTPESAPDAFHAQVRDLWLRVTGIPLPADATEPEEAATLWKQLHSVEASPTRAWAGVVSAALRDPRVLFY